MGTPFACREKELEFLGRCVEETLGGKGCCVFLAGEAGIGKTTLVERVIEDANALGFKILRGYCQKESLAPYMGVREALRYGNLEHLMADIPPPRVECVYLINNSGLLISKVERTESALDPEVFGAMLVAVNTFVKDSLSMLSGEEISKGGRLNRLDYSKWTIMINHGSYLNLVTIAYGEPDEFLKTDMEEILHSIEKEYGEILKNWDGVLDKVQGMGERIKPLITSGKYDGVDYAKELHDPKLKLNRIYENILSGMLRESRKSPLLIFIDDLQWADPSTLGLLHYLARNIQKSRILIIGTYRPEDTLISWDGKTHQLVETMQLMSREALLNKIELQRFSKEDLMAVLNTHFGFENLNDEFFETIYRETEGNPLFALEVVKLLIGEGILIPVPDKGLYRLPENVVLEKIKIPDKVQNVIEHRLNKLEGRQREVLEAGAVEGEYFHSRTLETLVGLKRIELLKLLNTIEKSHKLIRSLQEKYRFEHVKIRELLYETINDELRKEYHKMIATALEEENKANPEGIIAELAIHYFLADEKEKATPYLMDAGKRAWESYATKEAIRFYRYALDSIERKKMPEVYAECLEKLGEIYQHTGDYESSTRNFAEAIAVLNAVGHVKEKIGALLRRIGENYEKQGDYDKSLEYCKKAKQFAEPESIEYARILLLEGLVYMRKGKYEEGINVSEKSFSISEKIGNEMEMAQAYHRLGSLHWNQGNYEAALAFLKKALAIREKLKDLAGIAAAYNNIGLVYDAEGDLNSALEYYKKSLEIFRKIGEMRGISIGYCNIGILHSVRGEPDVALEYYMKSLEVCKKIGDVEGLSICYCNMGIVFEAKGDLDVSLEYYEKSLELCEKIGEVEGIARNSKNVGGIYLEKGDFERAMKYYQKGLEIAEEMGNSELRTTFLAVIGELFTRTGKLREAIESTNKAIKLSEEIGNKNNEAEGYRVLGLIKWTERKWEEAEKAFERSLSIFEEMGRKTEFAKVYSEYGSMLLERKMPGDLEKARNYLQKALEIFDCEKMERWAEKVRTKLKENSLL
ncbi:MAG: tetratricopeptide repeat protein [Thermoplasmata archaeon]|nr:tetratricopeptide repeat protein [Thermoplasmata archaeon]